MKSWMIRVDVTTPLLQWGRNFIVAEIGLHGYSRKVGLLLQWGRNFIVAEMNIPHVLVILVACASMGPQLYRCGNNSETTSPETTKLCFNGAATLSLRKYDSSVPAPSGNIGFNGAATLSLRKSLIYYGYQHGKTRFNGAATLSLRKYEVRMELLHNGYASMGPQLYRCGNEYRPLWG